MSSNGPTAESNDKMEIHDSGEGYKKTSGRWKLFVFLLILLVLLIIALVIAVGVLGIYLEDEKERSNNLALLLNQNGSATETTHPRQITTTTSTPITDDIWLPRDVKPYLYEIELKPNFYTEQPSSFSFDGRVKIYIRCFVVTNKITLHTRDLSLNNESIVFEHHGSKIEGHEPTFMSYTRDEDREFMIFTLSDNLLEDENYTLSMDYSGPLRHDAVGLYWGDYKENNITRYTVSTQLEPEFSRKTFPCFDEPNLKAQFDIRLVRKSSYMTLSNMRRIKTDNRSDGFVVDIYERSIKMSTYLVAFVWCDYRHLEAYTNKGVLVRTWARKDWYTQSQFALDVVVKSIETFEDYFEINYSLDKSDNVALPYFEYFAAMENWGLIKYRENRMLYDPSVNTHSRKYSIAALVQHELAHMWFGNIVTCEWWSDIWLHEAFASYLEVIAHLKIHPDWKAYDLLLVEFQRALDLDDFPTSRSLFTDVWKHPGKMFALLTYDKGTALVRQLHFILGNETFRKGLKRYLLANAFGNARTEDLWVALQQQLDEEGRTLQIGTVMDTWVRQNNYPVVTIKRTENGNLVATQQRFIQNQTLIEESNTESPYGYRWSIPFTFTTSIERNFNKSHEDIVWMDSTDESVDIPNTGSIIPSKGDKNSWIIGNAGVTGFYRVMYDNDTWAAIAKQLHTNHKVIDSRNRAQLINDAWAFAKGERLDFEQALETTDYLNNEEEYIPWYSAYIEYAYFDEMLRFTKHYGVYQKYMLSKVKPVLTKVGSSNARSTLTEIYIRSLLLSLACLYKDSSCLNIMADLFQRWKDLGESIDPNLRQTAYCSAVAHQGEAAWNFLFETLKESNDTSERSRLRFALSCTDQLWLIQKYIDIIMNTNELNEHDQESALIDLARNPVGRGVVLEIILNNWVFLRKREPKFNLLNVIMRIAESFNNEMDKTHVNNILRLEGDGTLKGSLLAALKKIDTRIIWMDKYANKIATWMDQKLQS